MLVRCHSPGLDGLPLDVAGDVGSTCMSSTDGMYGDSGINGTESGMYGDSGINGTESGMGDSKLSSDS